MPISGGFKYIVDLRDDLSGWLEARMLRNANSKNVAKFLFEDVMCRFGCILQLTTDNGAEFEGLVQTMADIYNVPIARAAPYHPEANGMIERHHRTWIGSLFIACKGNPSHWSRYFYSCMWADRVTVKRATGHTPYYLLYGKHHVFPFDITDSSWYTLDWHSIQTTEELLAIRAIQLAHRDDDIEEASATLLQSRIRSTRDWAQRNEHTLVEGNYKPGTIVLVYNSVLQMQHGRKGEIRWIGPYRVRKQNTRGSYELNELDGTPIDAVFAGNRLKKYHQRDRIPKAVQSKNSSNESNEMQSIEARSATVQANPNDNDETQDVSRDFEYMDRPPISFGPVNQLRSYMWPPPRATDSWEFWGDKFIEWKRRNIELSISGLHDPQNNNELTPQNVI